MNHLLTIDERQDFVSSLIESHSHVQFRKTHVIHVH